MKKSEKTSDVEQHFIILSIQNARFWNLSSQELKLIAKVLHSSRKLLVSSLAQIWLSFKQIMSVFIKVLCLLITEAFLLKDLVLSNDIVRLLTSINIYGTTRVKLCSRILLYSVVTTPFTWITLTLYFPITWTLLILITLLKGT